MATTPAATVAYAGPALAADAAAASLGRRLAAAAVADRDRPGSVSRVLQGMARRLRRERDAMEHAAFSDSLTGVANRRLLMSVAEYEIARHSRADERFTVVMLDLDGFKLLNDRYGHAAGDQMLRCCARPTSGSCPPNAACTQAHRSAPPRSRGCAAGRLPHQRVA